MNREREIRKLQETIRTCETLQRLLQVQIQEAREKLKQIGAP